MKKISFFNKTLFILNCILVLMTLLGYAAPYVNPSTFYPIAFLGLGLPYLLLANLLFILFWLFKANSRFILSLLILGLGYKNIQSFVQVRFGDTEVTAADFKVMSFNVRVFDLYMWSKDKNARNQIFDFLKEEDPDVLCLQEFYHKDVQLPHYEFKTLDTLVKLLSARNYHVHYTTTLRKTDHWGMITFSKYPILNKGLVDLKSADDNACIYSDLKVDNDRIVRIYNAHLASIKLEKHDYKAMKKINEDYTNIFTKSAELLEKIKFGFEKRSSQAQKIHSSVEKSPYPAIVCGDFNDTPSSFAYQTIKGNLKDAYMESGSGLGRTYIGEFPSFRIDYLLYSEQLTAKNYTTHQEKLSDHHPVSAYFSIDN